jgi:hypothetical protein
MSVRFYEVMVQADAQSIVKGCHWTAHSHRGIAQLLKVSPAVGQLSRHALWLQAGQVS